MQEPTIQDRQASGKGKAYQFVSHDISLFLLWLRTMAYVIVQVARLALFHFSPNKPV
jgi:hypothetical protein